MRPLTQGIRKGHARVTAWQGQSGQTEQEDGESLEEVLGKNGMEDQLTTLCVCKVLIDFYEM